MSDISNIGSKIKKLRTQKNLTLKQLGTMTNMSSGFLSQLERGISTIAIDSLETIAKSLNVSIYYFIGKDDDKPAFSPIIKSYEKRVEIVNPRLHQSILTNKVNTLPYLIREITILPSSTMDELDTTRYNHEGVETIYVLEGILTIGIVNTFYDLYPGDTIDIDSTVDHLWQNKTNKIVKFLSVNSPNPFTRLS